MIVEMPESVEELKPKLKEMIDRIEDDQAFVLAVAVRGERRVASGAAFGGRAEDIAKCIASVVAALPPEHMHMVLAGITMYTGDLIEVRRREGVKE